MRTALARGQPFDDGTVASPSCSQLAPDSADAKSMVGPPRAVGLHDSLAARLCVAPFVCTMPLDSSRTTARACLARLRPSGEPCCTSVRSSPLAEVTIAVPSTPWPQHARIAKSITCLRRVMPARPDSPSVAISDRAGPLLHRPISCWRTFAKPCPCENGSLLVCHHDQ